ncbi:MAG: response regulator [Bacteroidia bacterium]|nr:response regulator [Bacteroidia bacterium]
MLKAIIIDDELRAVKLLQAIIEDTCLEDVSVVATCNDLPEGVKAIKKHKPDLVFLDIEMPGYSGLQILDFFNEDEIDFEIVFTTAYNDYALQAFKLSAIDYLLKPIQPELIREAVNRAINKINKPLNLQRYNALRQNLDTESSKKVAVAIGQSIKFLNMDEIVFIKADGAYSEIVMSDDNKLVISKNLKHFEDILSSIKSFIRVHKSYLINTKFVSEYVKSDGGYLILKEKYEVNITHDKVEKLLQVIGTN